jgi:hypothetical protein
VEPGVWEPAPKERYSRCGNYAVRWDEDLTALPPGGVMPLDREMLSLDSAFDVQQAGRYRITAHYQYSGGTGRRGLFGFGESVPIPPELYGIPTFEVVSAPVEITILRPFELEVTVKAPLVITPTTPIDSVIDVTLTNESGSDLPVPGQGDEHRISVEMETDDWRWTWYSPWDRPSNLPFAQGQTLAPGEGVSVLKGVTVPVGEGRLGPITPKTIMVRIRASVWTFRYDDPRHVAVRSAWIEAPIEWRGP